MDIPTAGRVLVDGEVLDQEPFVAEGLSSDYRVGDWVAGAEEIDLRGSKVGRKVEPPNEEGHRPRCAHPFDRHPQPCGGAVTDQLEHRRQHEVVGELEDAGGW